MVISSFLEGARCSPTRLPRAIVLTLWRIASGRHVGMVKCRPQSADLAIIAIAASVFASCFFFMSVLDYQFELFTAKHHWTIGLLANFIGYSSVFLPGVAVVYYVESSGYLSPGGATDGCLAPILKRCFYGTSLDISESISASVEYKKVEDSSENSSGMKKFMHIIGCFMGLQFSYLTWGLLQEKIMTQKYQNTSGDSQLFTNSQFLVFVNRILAFGISLAYVTCAPRHSLPTHRTPIYKYSFCSLSNILSSWCQYEALKFVSFPTQVLAKASKLIPTMAMSRMISGKTYQRYEYLVAVTISIGMFLFLFGSQETVGSKVRDGQVTTFSGFILLVGYLVSDAFTSNWQKELFVTYKMSPVQAMCGVNLFSCLFTSVSLLQQDGFFKSLVFMSQFPKFTFDCIVLSLCSAFGQLFIFHTIDAFGPVVFVIIMTIRQAIAILLSCLTYGHAITGYGAFGVTVVFGASFFKIYYDHLLRKRGGISKKLSNNPSSSVAMTLPGNKI